MSQTKVEAPFVENNVLFRNKFINGDMNIAQRATSVTGVTQDGGHLVVDRFRINGGATTAGRFTLSQHADGPSVSGLTKCLKFDCTTADTSIAAGELMQLHYRFEGQHLQDLYKGTAGAKKITLSFYVKGNATAKYTASFYDNDNSRLIGQTFDVTTSWTRVVLTYNADTTGTLDNDNNNSMALYISLHGGSNYTSGTFSENTWEAYSSTRFIGDSTTSFFDSTDREFFITGVQLEVGDQASDFEQVPFDVQLARCKRYYEKIQYEGQVATMAATSTSAAYARIECEVEKRADPTVTLPTAGNSTNEISVLTAAGSYPGTIGSHAVGNPTPLGFRLQASSYGNLEAGGGLMLYVNGTVNIEFDAEL
tara:strand:- start:180 stop:1277 length:1098 start_codon:yes stop_codon:yes gene_type:complete